MNKAFSSNLIKSRAHRILGDLTEKCIDNGIKLVISPEDSIYLEADGSYCSGYFNGDENDPRKNILTFATGKPIDEWIVVALHEGCHMDQFIEQASAWTDIRFPNESKDSTDLLFEWISGKDTSYDVADLARRSLSVELDCERRTHEKLFRYGLDDYIDPTEYVQKSNSYIYFYLYLLKTRRWSDRGRPPYSVAEIWKEAPKTFDGDYTKIPPNLLEAYRKHLYATH